MSLTLLRLNVKLSYKLWGVFFIIMMVYKTIILSMYDPAQAEGLESMMELMPQALIDAMGFTIVEASLNGFLAGYYYGFIIVFFPTIFLLIVSWQFMGKMIDEGSMSIIIAQPIHRRTIALTQAFSIFGITFDLFAAVTLAGIILSALMFPGELAIGAYVLMNAGAFMLFAALGAIIFSFACCLSKMNHSLTFSIAIPIAFFIIDMIKDLDPKLNALQYFTIFTLFDNAAAIKNDGAYWRIIVLAGITVAFYTLAIHRFVKKDLTL